LKLEDLKTKPQPQSLRSIEIEQQENIHSISKEEEMI